MVFAGMQKLSLLDYPGLVSCTLFTPGCNFRCPFCHNAGLLLPQTGERIPAETVLSYLEKRRGLLDGITVTGGEPLIHPDLAPFLQAVIAMGYRVKLDTNGSQPERLKALVEQGLVHRVAMDIKNSPGTYGITAGLPELDISPIEESKDFLMRCGIDYEFRTTVVRGLHTPESLSEAAHWIRGAREYYLQGFVDSGSLLNSQGLEAFSQEEMEAFLAIVQKDIPAAQLRGL